MVARSKLRKNRIENESLAVARLEWLPAVAILYPTLIYPIYAFGIHSSSSELISVEAADGNTLNKVYWVCTASFALMMLKCVNRKNNLVSQAPALAVYFVICVLSIIWSDFVLITARRVALQLCLILTIASPFVARGDSERVLSRVFFVFALATIANIVAFPLVGLPDFGYNGIMLQKNILGQLTVIAIAFSIREIFMDTGSRKWFATIILILSVSLLGLTKSKTSQGLAPLILLICLFFYVSGRVNATGRIAIRFVFFVFVGIVVISVTYPSVYSVVSLQLFGDTTFTNRTAIWEFAFRHIGERPLLGHGFGAFWGVGEETTAIADSEGFISGLLQAHNGYVDILLETGYIGLAIIFFLLVSVGHSAVRAVDDNRASGFFLLYMFIFCLMNNLMESSIFRSDAILWQLLLIVTFAVYSRVHERRTEPLSQIRTVESSMSGFR